MKDRTSERIENITTEESGEGTFFDLSSTGVCCYHGKRIEKGTFVSVKINDLMLKARIVKCSCLSA